jgi:hypothetical protein
MSNPLSWKKWYAEARDAAKFWGFERKIPLDFYKEKFAIGCNPEFAVKQWALRAERTYIDNLKSP